jgi:hypothetical protein
MNEHKLRSILKCHVCINAGTFFLSLMVPAQQFLNMSTIYNIPRTRIALLSLEVERPIDPIDQYVLCRTCLIN